MLIIQSEKTLPTRKKIYWFYIVDIFGLFHMVHRWFCSKTGKILSQFDFGQMSLEIMFDDHPSRKQAFLDYTNIDSKQWPYWDFFEGVNPWFWSKIGNFTLFCLFLDKNSPRNNIIIMSDDHLVKKRVSHVPSQSVRQSVSQPVNQSVCQLTSQWASQSVSQSVSKSVSQPASKSVSQSVNKPVS